MQKKFEHNPDSGRLMAAQTKHHEKAPDYWGEIAINVNDMTKVERQGDLLIFKLDGWKRKAASGATYLRLSVNRWMPDSEPARPTARPTKKQDIEDDIPW